MIWTIVITAVVTILLVVLAMNFATPEKKLERKIEHRYAIADPQFQHEMSVMMGPAITAGNSITPLNNGAEIFPAMLEAISAARQTVAFETYIYWSGEIGREFTQALSDRARAGVAVNVTIDWAGSIKMDQALLDQMEQAGVQVHRYRPLRWYNLGRMNNRTHRKLLVLDGKIAFTGGVGIADQWQGSAQDSDHWRDMHFRIEGPVVAQFQAAFNDNWIKTTGEVLNGAEYFPSLQPAGDVKAHLFISSPAGGSESMHLMYLMSIAAAERSIDLTASYFVPDKLIVDALLAALGRGVPVRIMLPGPYIDSETVRIATKAEWGDLLQAGAEFHVYQPTMLHVKLLIVDHEMVSVGSTNFDNRSFRLNDEATLNIVSRSFAQQQTAVFEADLAQSRRISYAQWAERPMREKLAEWFSGLIASQL